MDKNGLKKQLDRLNKQIDALPHGSISTKKVNGHTYYYHRCSHLGAQDGRIGKESDYRYSKRGWSSQHLPIVY